MTQEDFIQRVEQHPRQAILLCAVSHVAPIVLQYWPSVALPEWPPVQALKLAVDWVFLRTTDHVLQAAANAAVTAYHVDDDIARFPYGYYDVALAAANAAYIATTTVYVVPEAAAAAAFYAEVPFSDVDRLVAPEARQRFVDNLGPPGRWGKRIQLRTGRWWMGDYLYEAGNPVDGVPLSWTRVPATNADLVAMDEAMEAGLI
jgi:hypothetical protein